MSTRGAWGFSLDGRLIMSPIGSDAYPSGWGAAMADFGGLANPGQLPAKVRSLRLIEIGDWEEEVTADEAAVLQAAGFDISAGDDRAQLEEAAAECGPHEVVDAGVMIADFSIEETEWVYLFDLDRLVLEVHTDRLSPQGRLAQLGLHLLGSWPLGQVPGAERFDRELRAADDQARGRG